MSENKLVKSLTDAAVVVGIASGIGYVGKKNVEGKFYKRPKHFYSKLWQMGVGALRKSIRETIFRRSKDST